MSVRVQLDHGLGVVDVSFETSMQHDGTPHEPMELVKVKPERKKSEGTYFKFKLKKGIEERN